MPTILVTGGLGFIGSHLVDRLIREGFDVIVLDDYSSGRESNLESIGSRNLKIIRGTILDRKVAAIAVEKANTVVHLAAIVSVQRSIAEPYLSHEVNVTGTLNLLLEASKNKVQKFVFGSSAAVYGKSEILPLQEILPLNPMSPYGASKAASEAYCKAFFESMGLNTVILRFMNVYGPRRSSGLYAGVMTKFAEAISTHQPLVIYGDGEQSRDFTYVSDIVDAIRLSIESEKANGVLMNVGTGKPTTINQLAETFEQLSKGPIVKRRYMKPRLGDIRSSYADISIARKIIGFTPKTELESGVHEFLNWYGHRVN